MSTAAERFTRPQYAPGMLEFWDATLLEFYRRLHLRGRLQLLDVGCGAGLLVDRARRDGMDSFGVEPFWPVRPPRIVRGFAEAIPFRTGTFDALTCFSVLEYVADPRVAIAEMARVLRPGGRAYLAVPEFADYPLLRAGSMRQRTSGRWLLGLLSGDWRVASTTSFGLKLAVPIAKRLRLARLLPLIYWRSYPGPLADMSFVELERVGPG